MNQTELIVVAAFRTRIEAELAQGALSAAGIESALAADDAGGQYASLLVSSHGVRLQVRPEDAEAAQELLGQRGTTTGAE